ncbi:MAG: diacylglycerol kinase family protein [Deltaproteobacteria bacterium]|nr:diacylglycerol kinase family protein [Deltaproteobacteria bacterium]
MKVLIIGNSISGRGKTPRRVYELAGMLKYNGHNVEVFLSSKPREALVRAASIGADFQRIVIAGGDGTVNEVLNGLVDPSIVPILHLATGTANMLARELGLPTNIAETARLVETGRILPVDMGVISGRRFLLVASAGFDSFVTLQMTETRKQTLGYRGYLRPIFKAGLRYHPTRLKVWVDDQEPVTGEMVMVLKTRYYGGLLIFDEEARPNSGFFLVRVFPHGTLKSVLKYGVAGLTRRICRFHEVIRLKGLSVRIESQSKMPLQVDGDHCCWTPAEIKIHPCLVPIVVPSMA